MELYGLVIAWASIIISVAAAGILKYRKRRGAFYTIVIGVFTAGVSLFFPIFRSQYPLLHSCLYSIIRTIQMFILNSTFDGFTSTSKDSIGSFYELTLGLLHIAAPVLSATAILSAISDKIALLVCYLSIHKDKYIFSEINKKSLSLAVSIKNTKKNALIIFSDENTSILEPSLLDAAKGNGFFIVKKAIDALSWKMGFDFKEIHYFLISENDSENLSSSIKLIEKNLYNPNVFVYTFADSKEAEMVLDHIKNEKPKINIRLINEAQTIAYQLLHKNPVYHCLHGKDEKMEILMVGLGDTGTEILKAMIWCNTYLHHEVHFTICDSNMKERESFFRRACPALNCEEYHLRFHQENLDISSHDIFDFIENDHRRYHYIIISTGNDDLNLRLALDLKSFYARKKEKPQINVLVKDKWKSEIGRNYLPIVSKQEINLFGCYEDIFKCEVIVDETVQKMAMGINLIYEEGYNPGVLENANPKTAYEKWNLLTSVLQRSNKALALHIPYRLWEQGYVCSEEDEGGKEIDYLRDVLQEDDQIITEYAKLEHKRWNAYMLTEGWHPFDDGEQVTDGKMKLLTEKKHAAITHWEGLVEMDRTMPHSKLVYYDKNFVIKTGTILQGLNHKLDYGCKIIKRNKEG